MIIVKVFESGENRETRVEEAIFRFLFPDQLRPERPRKKPAESGPPPIQKEKTGIRNKESGIGF